MTAPRRRGRRAWGKIRQRSSGHYEATYTGPDLQRHRAPHTFQTRMDAEAFLIAEKRLIDGGGWTPPAKRAAAKRHRAETLGEYGTKWIEHRNLKPRTRDLYTGLLRGPVAPLADMALTAVTAEDVRSWHADMGTSTPTRRSHAYALLHAIYETAVDDGRVAMNPCRIRKAMNVQPKKRATILDVPEVNKLALALKPDRLAALIYVAAWCGCRWGELIELRRKDVSADASIITVARGATHRNGQCFIDSPKSGKGRTVTVPPHVQPILLTHLAAHVADDPEALLFPAAKGGCHLNDRVFRDYFTAAAKAIGREGLSVHQLRHFAGTQAARVGNLVETMARLGHSTPRASLIYTQMVNGRDAEIAAALSAMVVDPAAT